jgi:hypothetical protein
MAALPGQLLALYLFGLLATGVLAAGLYLLLRHRRSRWVSTPWEHGCGRQPSARVAAAPRPRRSACGPRGSSDAGSLAGTPSRHSSPRAMPTE